MRVGKLIGGSFCALMTATGVYNTAQEPSMSNFLLTAAFAVLTWMLLIRKPGKKRKSQSTPASKPTLATKATPVSAPKPTSVAKAMPAPKPAPVPLATPVPVPEPAPVPLATPVPVPKPAPVTKPAAVEMVNVGKAMSERIELNVKTAASIRRRFIAFDVETTGFQRMSDRIVEIGAVLFSDGKPEKTFSSLVNPGIPMPPSASRVNHITDAMLAEAPSEKEVYPKLIDFLGDALQGKTIMCAHNASFDFDFLCNTLSRLGYDASIQYVDTLPIARENLLELPNHKQATLEAHFGLTNDAAHRAGSDATNCGYILLRLLDTAEEAMEAERKKLEKVKPSAEELEVCAYVQQLIADRGGDTTALRYKKSSAGYVDMCCLYVFLKMKFGKKGRYILAKKEWTLPEGFRTEPCVQSEGGTDFVRVFFSSPFDLAPLSEYIYQAYDAMHNSMESYASCSDHTRRETESCMRQMYALSDKETAALLKAASEHDYAPLSSFIASEPPITRADVVLNAVHHRVPLSEIKNLNDEHKGFEQGFPYWAKGENARKAGEFDKAIKLFDKARYHGYEAQALYDSYAIVYRQLKDYSNEIEILDEGIARIPEKASKWIPRREKAIKLLFTQQEKERTAGTATEPK